MSNVIQLPSKLKKNGKKTRSQKIAKKVGKAHIPVGSDGTSDSAQIQVSSKGVSAKKIDPLLHLPAEQLGQPWQDWKLDTARFDAVKAFVSSHTMTEIKEEFSVEYSSWKNRKSFCKNHASEGYVWPVEWNGFTDFLMSQGPAPIGANSLDRIVTPNKHYGFGLCQWSDNTHQNNNKSDNVKIEVPLIGMTLTVNQIAKMHGVQPTTVYKWVKAYYSTLELLAGKKNTILHKLQVALDELPKPEPKGKKPPKHKFPPLEWKPAWVPSQLTDEEVEHYNDTGEYVNLAYHQARAEYVKLAEWIKAYNAGLAKEPPPPPGKFVKIRLNVTPPTSEKSLPSTASHYDFDEDAQVDAEDAKWSDSVDHDDPYG